MDGSHQRYMHHTLEARDAHDAPASVEQRRRVAPETGVGSASVSIAGPLREGENLGALLTAYRAERDCTAALWHEAMLHLRDYRYDKAALCALELSRRAREGAWEPLPFGDGLASLREWLAIWQAEAQRILGELLAPVPAVEACEYPLYTPPRPSPPPSPPPTPQAPSLDPSRLARRLSRWKGEEQKSKRTSERGEEEGVG
jgi:hypothetical protein